MSQYTMLGGIQARLELGPYNPQVHSNKYLRQVILQFGEWKTAKYYLLIHFTGAKKIDFFLSTRDMIQLLRGFVLE